MNIHCQLCELAHLTKWYHEDNICVVLICKTCQVPMVIFRPHRDPTTQEIDHCITQLKIVADEVFGQNRYIIPQEQRQIKDHFHRHARRK